MEKTKKVIRISKRGTAVFVIVLVIIGTILLGFWLTRPREIINYGYNNGISGVVAPTVSRLDSKVMYPEYPMPYPQNNLTVNDTREFLKTSYNAEIKTRNVESTVRGIKSAVRDVAGRVDSSNENPKNGYVSFVVPKSNFENFKDEITSITNAKLITEGISSENLLGQKQSIEQQQQSANASLSQLQQQQKDLASKHSQIIAGLKNNLTARENDLSQVQLLISSIPPYDTFRLSPLQAQESGLTQTVASLKQQISSENSSFNTKNQNLKNQIDDVNTQLTYIAQQDSNFNDNIETVSGYVSVQWISLWQLISILSPVSPIIIIIVLAIILWLILRKKNFMPRIEFV